MPELVSYFKPHTDTKIVIQKSLRLGTIITPRIEYIFSNGQCHSLAAALHEILKWPIIGCYSWHGGDRSTSHFVLETPSGLLADIHGIRCIDYGRRRASYQTIVKGRVKWCLPPAMAFARHYAPMIAAEIEKQQEAISQHLPKPKWTLCSEGYLSQEATAKLIAKAAVKRKREGKEEYAQR